MVRKLLFYGLLVGLLIAVNTGQLVAFLDAVIGVQWSTPIVSFLEENSQGFLIVLAVTLYLEYIRDERLQKIMIHKDDVQNILSFQQKFLKSGKQGKEIIKQVLSSEYEINHPEALINYILQDKPIYKNVDIRYVLSDDHENVDKYDWSYDIWFDTEEDEFIVAATTHSYIQDLVSKNCPKICDVITIPSADGLISSGVPSTEITKTRLNDAGESIKVAKVVKDTVSQTKETSCQVSLLSDRQSLPYLRGLDKKLRKDVVVFRAKLGKGVKRIHFRAPSVHLNKDDHYIYWMSDRVMYVNKIEFDVRNFSYNNSTRFLVHPFLVNYLGKQDYMHGEKHFVLEVDNWISVSQGAILSWR